MDKKEQIFEEMRQNASESNVEKIRQNLGSMNRGKIAEVWDKVMTLWRFVQDPEAPWSGKALAIAALLYLISPIDAIPDVIPVLGLTDDAGIIALVIAKLASDLKNYTNN